jgi:hypothetical protein
MTVDEQYANILLKEVFEDFIKELENDKEFPKYVINNLKKFKTADLTSKETILETLKREDSDED